MRLFIAGSCVSRDAFTPKNSDQFVIGKYTARYSLARLALPAIDTIPRDKLDLNLKSKFQKRILISEMENNLLGLMSEIEFDKLLIDCVDERFGLIEYLNTYVTNSDEFRRAKLTKNSVALKIQPHTQEYFDLWELGFKKVIDQVGKDKIIVNDVYWANKLDSGDAVSTPQRIEYCNEIMRNLYKIAGKYISKNQFVNYPKEIFVGDSNHKWGKSPFHYTQDVYDYLIQYLQRFHK